MAGIIGNPTPRVGDSGTVVEIDMEEDLSDATKLQVKILKPDEVTELDPIDGTYTGSGNVILKVTLPTLDQEGDWVIVPYTEGLSSWTGHGDPFYMHVYGVFEIVGD